jgi:hypothetical protein
MPMTRLALLLRWGCAAMLLLAAASVQADQPSLIGARPLDRGDRGWWLQVGYPDLEIGGRLGQSSVSDLGARLRLSWGTPSTAGGFGVSAALLGRLRMAQVRGWDVAVHAEPGLFLHGGVVDWAPLRKTQPGSNQNLLGVDFGVPAVEASRWIDPTLHVAVGLAAPLRLHVLPEPTWELPVLLRAAGEWLIAKRHSALIGLEIGHSFYGPGAGSPASEWVYRVRVGAGWR